MQDSRGMQDTEANMNRTTIEGVSMAAMADTGPKSKGCLLSLDTC